MPERDIVEIAQQMAVLQQSIEDYQRRMLDLQQDLQHDNKDALKAVLRRMV